jgi:KaiC/GvpD/RAD55 family RecA-like ATPase
MVGDSLQSESLADMFSMQAAVNALREGGSVVWIGTSHEPGGILAAAENSRLLKETRNTTL